MCDEPEKQDAEAHIRLMLMKSKEVSGMRTFTPPLFSSSLMLAIIAAGVLYSPHKQHEVMISTFGALKM